jgi:hypothetical protein
MRHVDTISIPFWLKAMTFDHDEVLVSSKAEEWRFGADIDCRKMVGWLVLDQ